MRLIALTIIVCGGAALAMNEALSRLEVQTADPKVSEPRAMTPALEERVVEIVGRYSEQPERSILGLSLLGGEAGLAGLARLDKMCGDEGRREGLFRHVVAARWLQASSYLEGRLEDADAPGREVYQAALSQLRASADPAPISRSAGG